MLFSAPLESRHELPLQFKSSPPPTPLDSQGRRITGSVKRWHTRDVRSHFGKLPIVWRHESPRSYRKSRKLMQGSLLKFTSSPFIASSVPRIRAHTHTLEAHTADNRRTLGSKLTITPWRPQHGSSTRREGTSLSKREITLSLSVTKHHSPSFSSNFKLMIKQ